MQSEEDINFTDINNDIEFLSIHEEGGKFLTACRNLSILALKKAYTCDSTLPNLDFKEEELKTLSDKIQSNKAILSNAISSSTALSDIMSNIVNSSALAVNTLDFTIKADLFIKSCYSCIDILKYIQSKDEVLIKYHADLTKLNEAYDIINSLDRDKFLNSQSYRTINKQIKNLVNRVLDKGGDLSQELFEAKVKNFPQKCQQFCPQKDNVLLLLHDARDFCNTIKDWDIASTCKSALESCISHIDIAFGI